ncbi:MAG: hypothetical protein MUE81_22655 [Thermoflexibacter sp.]|jgi:hypothetical protein|nr:hypothetical protein [Thermoflexibacter sp.]
MRKHGNANENDNLHHLYEIDDIQEEDIFKYGISGKPLNPDGTSARAEEQINILNKAVGFKRFISKILMTEIEGRVKAKELEQQHIDNYEKKHGKKPRGNI